MLYRVLIVYLLIQNNVLAEDEYKIVSLKEGDVKGVKYWNGDHYEYYGVKYASVPRGRNRYKAPLPPEPWEGVFEAKIDNILCTQVFFANKEENEDDIAYGQEDCLTLNLFVPVIANEDNLIPVVVYIHSGGFAIGHGNMAKFNYLVRHDVLVISVNYRLGALGFLCLGTEDIPGNAGLKDQVAALRWINKNIKKFGGDPNKVTVAGFSVGAGMAELLALSKTTTGLIDKIILESGSALSPWAINRHPITTAINIAKSLGYNDTGNIKDLTEFYLNINADAISIRSLNFFLKNGTFGFAPCIENVHIDTEAFLTESPYDIMKNGKQQKVSVLTGFANMEGLSRSELIDEWKHDMEENFSEFLPTDLQFPTIELKEEIAKEVKYKYFGNKVFSEDAVENYTNYFSDSMFTFSIMQSAKHHSILSPVYLYEFSYVGDLSTKHRFMNVLRGASHRDQTAYILDFYSWTANYNDMDTRDRMTLMWADFIKYGDPVAYENVLIKYKWPQYKNDNPIYLAIDRDINIKENLLVDRHQIWDKLYKKYYFNSITD